MFQFDDAKDIYEFDCGNETYIIKYGEWEYTLCGKCKIHNIDPHYIGYSVLEVGANDTSIWEHCIVGSANELERIVTDFNRLITEQYEIDGVKFTESEEKFRLL